MKSKSNTTRLDLGSPEFFLHEHTVHFEETSLVGNVYFTNYMLWQGHCRESFLREHASEVLDLLSQRKIQLFTRGCTCDYLSEWGFSAHDRVRVEMRLESFRGGKMTLSFRYAHRDRPEQTIAVGSQVLCCIASSGDAWVPAPFPSCLAKALIPFAGTPELRTNLDDAIAFNASRTDLPTP